MKLLEQIYQQRRKFLQQNLTPTVVLVPYDMRHELIGEALDTYGLTYHKPKNKIGVMGMRVVFSHDVHHLEVLMGMD